MNPQEIFVFLRNLLRDNAEGIAGFVTGIVFAVTLHYLYRRWTVNERESAELQNVRRQLHNEQAKSETLNKIVGEKDSLVVQLSQRRKELREQLAQASAGRDQADSGRKSLESEFLTFKKKAIHTIQSYKKQIALLQQQVQEVEQLEGKIWERPAKGDVPAFRPLHERRGPIIAVFNLKGGVGKTSLTAHLGAALWGMGKKTLLVDLDYQASLTHLVLPLEQVKVLAKGGKFVQRVLTSADNYGPDAWSTMEPVHQSGSHVLAASEDLARVEEMTKAEWLVNANRREPRYALRAALHHERFQRHFDYVLLDCPPRLSMACINALTACDYVLIPTLFDKTSREAVFRLLDLLVHLRRVKLCPDLEVLGVVGNKSYRQTGLTDREKTYWDQLTKITRDHWGAAVYHFKRFLPNSANFAKAAETRLLADQRPELNGLFKELVQEMEKELTRRDRSHAEGAGSAAAR